VKNTVSGVLRSHDETYDDEYYESLEAKSSRSAGPIALSVVRDLDPKTLLDVGCGTGAILAAFAARGVEVTGLEYSEAALRYCRARSLKVYKIDLESKASVPFTSLFDIVVSMEVAEHLPGRMADRFVRLLTSYGGVVIFTAAIPGQGGNDHVNEQPHEYWVEKFAKRGFAYLSDRSLAWRDEWERQGVAWWYSRNLMVFGSAPTLARVQDNTRAEPVRPVLPINADQNQQR